MKRIRSSGRDMQLMLAHAGAGLTVEELLAQLKGADSEATGGAIAEVILLQLRYRLKEIHHRVLTGCQ